jgi:hypothetical protein
MIRIAGATGRKDKTFPVQNIPVDQEYSFLRALIFIPLDFPPVNGSPQSADFPLQLVKYK